jgi:general secretion pathway protein G
MAVDMRERGFTLIEIVVTVAIVGLLASAVLPLAELGVKRGREQDLRTALRELRTAIDAYKDAADRGRIELEVGASGYPPSLEVLADGVIDIANPDGKKIYFLRKVPRDPFYRDPTASAAATWGLRSYASEPDKPEPGDDVYDVYSTATGKGLNGIAYRDW